MSTAKVLSTWAAAKTTKATLSAHVNLDVWEEEEDNEANSDTKAIFNKEAFLSVLL